MSIIETHCHLDYFEDIDSCLSLAKEAGVEKLITIGVSPWAQDEILHISQVYPEIYCTQGVHPHKAKFYEDCTTRKILKNTQNKKVVAIGECGLDYYYENSTPQEQKKAFEIQLELAAKVDLPVVIHTREADEDTLAILKNHSSSLKQKGVLHSFTSGKKLAEYALTEGFYLGFNGIITFKNAQDIRDIVSLTPIDRILTETDSPYLTPVPHRGKKNSPQYLPHIVEKICEIKELEDSSLFKDNALRLFTKLSS